MEQDLYEYRLAVGNAEFWREYRRLSRPTKRRHSGRTYENPPEKIEAIREKYKNGVPMESIEKLVDSMFEGIKGN